MEMKLRSDMKPSVQCLYCLEMADTDADHREISVVLRSCLTNRQYSVRVRLLYPSFHSALSVYLCSGLPLDLRHNASVPIFA